MHKILDNDRTRCYIEFEPYYLNTISHIGKATRVEVQQHYNHLHTHHNVLEIMYVMSGDQTTYVNGEEFKVKGGELFFAFPDELHGNDKSFRERTSYCWIGINLDPDHLFLQYPSRESLLMIETLRRIDKRIIKGQPLFKKLLTDIINVYLSEDPLKELKIKTYCTEFLLKIIELIQRKNKKSISTSIKQTIDFITENISEEIQISELAEIADLSESRFKHRFKLETGHPPKEYILRKKIDRAKKLLALEHYSITDIAYQLSFSSSQYFSTVFKRYTGSTPKDFTP